MMRNGKVIIRTDKVEGFFDRAQKAAQKADRGESFKKSATFSFEDPQEMFMVLSEARRRLMLEVMDKPNYQGYWTLREIGTTSLYKRGQIWCIVLRSW